VSGVLDPQSPFPPLEQANAELGGLLAVGGDLSPRRLLDAYARGIFPWGTHQGQPLWYAPDPRMVMIPADFSPSRSLRKTLRGGGYTIRLDTAFTEVIAACAAQARPGQAGTWISSDMQTAYRRLHELGWAHSVETWVEGELVGGLYGLAIGKAFFGESMFSRRTDASKIAFAHLCRYLSGRAFGIIDCQMHTQHLASLGAAEIPRDEFVRRIATLTADAAPGRWAGDGAEGKWG